MLNSVLFPDNIRSLLSTCDYVKYVNACGGDSSKIISVWHEQVFFVQQLRLSAHAA